MITPARFARAVACLGTALCLALGTSPLHADIRVGAMHHYFAPDQRTLTKQIRNTGTTTAYVRVDIAAADEQGQALTDQNTTDVGLLVSPSRLIIPAGGSHTVRMLLMGPRHDERYYRVRFVPVPPTKAHGFEVSVAETDAFRAEVGTSIQVMIGYGVFVVGAPVAPRLSTTVHDAEGSAWIRNEGDTSLLVHDHRICSRADDRCRASSFTRIGPGKTWIPPGGDGEYHRFDLQEGSHRRSLVLGK
jgi:hypothetical protein